MLDPSIQRGIESIVAEFLRAHVLDAVLGRPEIAAALGAEKAASLRAEILLRLERQEAAGKQERDAVWKMLEGLLRGRAA